jgi:hypothetical protein
MPAAAPTNNNYSTLVDVATTQQFMRGVFDNTIKRNIILKKLYEAGTLKGEGSGKFLERTIRAGTYASATRGDLAERQFVRRQQNVTQAVPYGVIEVTGALGEQDIMFNSGKEALIKLNAKMMSDMGADFRKDISSYILRNNAGSNATFGQSVIATAPVPLFGLPTMFGYGASAQNYNADTQATSGAVGAGDREVLPNTTYFGVTTHPTAAISGVDGRVNEATSPVLGNYTSTAWTGTATWAANCLVFSDYMLTRLARSQDAEDQCDLIVLTRTMYNDVANRIQTNFGRTMFTAQAQSAANVRVGNGDVIPYGNAEISWDVSQPANVAYYLNTRKLEFIYFPQKAIRNSGELSGDLGDMSEMFGVRTDYDIKQGGHLAVAVLAAQMYANPFFHGAGYNFA